MPPEFGYLQSAKALELVRVKINDAGQWAIVGVRESSFYYPLVVLSGKETPYVVNLIHNGKIDGDFDAFEVLRYGTNYDLRPEHAGHCELGEGPLFRKAGALILANKDSLLVVSVHPNEVRYLDLGSGKLLGEPGGGRAAFAHWTLRSDAVGPITLGTVLIKTGAG